MTTIPESELTQPEGPGAPIKIRIRTSPLRRLLRHEYVRCALLGILLIVVVLGYVRINHNYRKNFEESVDNTNLLISK